jgi:tRNA-2-methylthio-N6-dimethylallyladenosine synthase
MVPVRGKLKDFYLETFGCQMNVHDSEKIAGLLRARGYRPVDRPEEAGLILYNTCSVREKAARKVYSRLGVLKKRSQNRGQTIGVLGCVAQQEGERMFARAPHVNLVCGSASYAQLPQLLEQLERGETHVTGLTAAGDNCFETAVTSRRNPFWAYVTIIEGCNKECAYCVVPGTRGPERSRPSDRILAECRRLADEGYTEIQLLGQNVNSYGDPSIARRGFAELLVRVAEVKGLRRVRFATSHPRDFTPDIVQAIENHPVLCEQIHLPVQSGSSAVLRRMQRGYTREEYLEKTHCIRSAKRAMSISTDLIVGFCGETEEDFDETLSLLDTVGYDQAFTFVYSPRPDTPAARLADTVPEEEKKRRLTILMEHQRQIQLQRNRELIGQELEVLVEGFQPRLQQAVGRTSSNRVLNFPGRREWRGQYFRVRVTAAAPNSLVGVRVEAAELTAPRT